MSTTRHKYLVLIASLALTGLLLGALGGGYAVLHGVQAKFDDAEFLRTRLVELDGNGNQVETPTPAALVRVDVAQRKAITPQRSIVGRLVEVQKTTVASEVTGKIVGMPVEEGAPVVGGETVVAQVDDVWARLAVEASRAQVASTEAELKYELLELDRVRELRGKNAISQSELELSEATVARLQANLEQYKTAVEEHSERQLRSTIVAPFDGSVVAKYVELGSHVSPGAPIVDIVSRGRLDALLMIPESSINLIHLDQVLPIRIDAVGEDIPGAVVSVTPYGPSASRTFPARIRLDDRDGRLKVGMSVTASIPTGPEREALVVPKDAVLVRPDGSTVWVVAHGDDGQTIEAQPAPVVLSAQMPGEYAIEPETDLGRRLLVSGAQVVIEGAERLTAGQRVRVVTLDGDDVQIAKPDAAPKGAKSVAAGRES